MSNLRFERERFVGIVYAKFACIAAFCVATAIASHAQTFTNLFDFDQTNGGNPVTSLVQGEDGNFYGTAAFGAKNGGTVFKITADGALTTLHNFCTKKNCVDGAGPTGLLLGPNGNFYGMTGLGGKNNAGTVFEISPEGLLKTLYNFCSILTSSGYCADGNEPLSTLVLARNGSFYGTTYGGGTSAEGSIFEITPSGTLTTLYSFCALPNEQYCSDGVQPVAGLVLGSDGNLYGTTSGGGQQDVSAGTVFKITPTGEFTTLYHFCPQEFCTDGETPQGVLAEGSDGYLYGATYRGGKGNYGTVFRIAKDGKYTRLHSFCSEPACADGGQPQAGVALGSDGNFYGTTYIHGAYNSGEVFQITPAGDLTVLYSFCAGEESCPDGELPSAAPMQATTGVFYGTTYRGGISGCDDTSCGVVYSIATGLGPFVQSNPAFGKVGRQIGILGNGLTGASGVTFNGVAATFTVVSDTLIQATVPTGAKTGSIEVTTPSGTLNSNVVFQVLP
jgi:uncharacterized repeat protein (TIGR03803 family)